MMPFSNNNGIPCFSSALIIFLPRNLCKLWIQLGMHIVFKRSRSKQIIVSILYNTCKKGRSDFEFTAIKKFEKTQGMLKFLICCFLKNFRYLYVSVFF